MNKEIITRMSNGKPIGLGLHSQENNSHDLSNSSSPTTSDSPREFKTELAKIEEEMEIINDPNKKDISWSEFIEYKQLEAKKSQLIKDHDAFNNILNKEIGNNRHYPTYSMNGIIGEHPIKNCLFCQYLIRLKEEMMK